MLSPIDILVILILINLILVIIFLNFNWKIKIENYDDIGEVKNNTKLNDPIPDKKDIVKYVESKKNPNDYSNSDKIDFNVKQYKICDSGNGCNIEEHPENLVKCANPSIQEKIESGKNPLKPNQIEATYNENNNYEIFYKEKYQFPRLYLDDPIMYSSNYNEYTNYAKPEQVDMKIVPSNFRGYRINEYGVKNIPEASNYAFKDSPAMKE